MVLSNKNKLGCLFYGLFGYGSIFALLYTCLDTEGWGLAGIVLAYILVPVAMGLVSLMVYLAIISKE